MTPKELQAEIEEQKRRFLIRGGEIHVIPTGKSGIKSERLNKREQELVGKESKEVSDG